MIAAIQALLWIYFGGAVSSGLNAVSSLKLSGYYSSESPLMQESPWMIMKVTLKLMFVATFLWPWYVSKDLFADN